jgi:hypothetical protein
MFDFLELYGNILSAANKSTVVGTNLCVPRPLEVRGKGIRGVGGAADKEACTVQTVKGISQRQYFVARCLKKIFWLT